tara:strand:+ start:1456 stop:1839 length:384 start_codon:yes stop_codon:yes gene_type:complete
MEPAFNLSSVRKTLRHGIEKNLWTLEDLDKESPDSAYWREQARKHPLIGDYSTVHVQKKHINLLRDPEPTETIEVINPRDFSNDDRSESISTYTSNEESEFSSVDSSVSDEQAVGQMVYQSNNRFEI